jgi:NAD-dependent SIR2 family protein deacetylase
VLSLTDYLIEIGAVPSPKYRLDDVVQCRQLLHRAICEVLYKKSEDLSEMERTNETLRLFLDLLQEEVENKELSIITTNYDTLIELLLLKRVYERNSRRGNPINDRDIYNLLNCIDFGTNFRDPFANKVVAQPQNPIFRFFKLHGSFTWLKCDLCEHIFINPYGDIVFQAYRDEIDEYNTCHCNDHLQLRTLIVAPSLVRDVKDPNLLHIWKNTLEALRNADEWTIIGYSMPGEDLMIKTLFIRALNGAPKKPKIKVVQLDDSFRSNYLSLFGKHQFITGGVDAFLQVPQMT